MVRRSTNSFAAKKRRLPHRAVIKRGEPFLNRDRHRLVAAGRPLPKYGPTKEEIEVLREASIRWGFSPGAIRRVVQAYRRRMFEDGNTEAAKYQASHAVAMYRPPGRDETMTVAMFLVEWAKTNHPGLVLPAAARGDAGAGRTSPGGWSNGRRPTTRTGSTGGGAR